MIEALRHLPISEQPVFSTSARLFALPNFAVDGQFEEKYLPVDVSPLTAANTHRHKNNNNNNNQNKNKSKQKQE